MILYGTITVLYRYTTLSGTIYPMEYSVGLTGVNMKSSLFESMIFVIWVQFRWPAADG